ncbi:CvpA family protein [Chloroflexota bacterium]
MTWVDILVIIILFLSFFGGLKEGAVKNSFSLMILIAAIPLAGLSYRLLAVILSFLPGTSWENFIGFFITLGLINVLLHFLLFLPRRFIQILWKRGTFYRLLGGALNILNASIGMVVFTLTLGVYPIIGWLEHAIANSSVLARLVEHLSFVQAMLPEIFQNAAVLAMTSLTM